MKEHLKILYFLFMLSFSSLMFGADNVLLTINYSVIGTSAGYDHITKMRVYIDGREAGESTPKKQTIDNYVTVNVSKGNHKIKAVLLAKNDNIWEERTKENDYSLDCIFEKNITFNSNKTVNLIFDLNQFIVIEESVSTSSIKNNNYLTELKKVNDYLKTFDNGYYGYLEIKDGYLYDRFKSGKYNEVLLDKLGKASIETADRKVIIPCKDNVACVFSTYTDSYHKQMSFSQSTDFNTGELITLLDNLISAYNGSGNSSESGTDISDIKGRKPNIDNTSKIIRPDNNSDEVSGATKAGIKK